MLLSFVFVLMLFNVDIAVWCHSLMLIFYAVDAYDL